MMRDEASDARQKLLSHDKEDGLLMALIGQRGAWPNAAKHDRLDSGRLYG